MTKEEFNKLDLCSNCAHNRFICYHKLEYLFGEESAYGCRSNSKTKRCIFYEKENNDVIHD